MFTGLVEAKSPVLQRQVSGGGLDIQISRPESFDDLKTGDSIACNGICLTLTSFDSKMMGFSLGAETLRVLGNDIFPLQTSVNLERSLRFGDRIHGHLVTGHVEDTGMVEKTVDNQGNYDWTIRAQTTLAPFIFKKGSLCVNGVSLTVNEVKIDGKNLLVEFCIIPETAQKTNLLEIPQGGRVSLETDYYLKIVSHAILHNNKDKTL